MLQPTGDAMATGKAIIIGELMATGEAEVQSVQTMCDSGIVASRNCPASSSLVFFKYLLPQSWTEKRSRGQYGC